LIELAAAPVRGRFAAIKQSARAACGDCPWWPLCHGGCPKDRAAAGALDRPSPLCAAYRQFFEVSAGWFRAEGRRLAERCRVEAEAARRAQQAAARLPRPTPTVGRNDPCPCGSGRKYKRCCGGSEPRHAGRGPSPVGPDFR